MYLEAATGTVTEPAAAASSSCRTPYLVSQGLIDAPPSSVQRDKATSPTVSTHLPEALSSFAHKLEAATPSVHSLNGHSLPSELEALRLEHARELKSAREEHRRDVQALQAHHEEREAQLHAWCTAQLSELEAGRQALVAAAAERQARHSAESATRQAMSADEYTQKLEALRVEVRRARVWDGAHVPGCTGRAADRDRAPLPLLPSRSRRLRLVRVCVWQSGEQMAQLRRLLEEQSARLEEARREVLEARSP